jgi:hypothetical protein
MRFLSDETIPAALTLILCVKFVTLLVGTRSSNESLQFYQHIRIGAEKEDFYDQIPIIIRELVYRLFDDNVVVLKAVNEAFTSLSKHVPATELVKHVEFMRNLLASMVSDARRRKGGVGDGEYLLPGFNMPKGKEVDVQGRNHLQIDEYILFFDDIYCRPF